MRTCTSPTIRLRLHAVVMLCLLACVAPALAQTTPLPPGALRSEAEERASWDAVAERAQAALEAPQTDAERLELIRTELALDREEAFRIAERGRPTVRALQAQLEALGPPLADGETEPADIAARRTELRDEIARANAPVIAAREAYERADLLISEIDATFRARSANRLLTRGPSPLRPSTWTVAAGELASLVDGVTADLGRRTPPLSGLALALGGVVLAALAALLLRRGTVGLIERRLVAARSPARRFGLLVARHLARAALAGGAALLVVWGLGALGDPPFLLRSASEAVAPGLLLVAFGYWLGHALFAPGLTDYRLVAVPDARAGTGVRLASFLGLVVGAEVVLRAVEDDVGFGPEAVAVLSLPFVACAGALVWRLGRLLAPVPTPAPDPGQDVEATAEDGPPIEIAWLLSTFLRVAAVVGLAASLAGYADLARWALLPTALSLGLVGLGIVLYNGIVRLLGVFMGLDRDGAERALTLLPVLIAAAIGLGALPLLALIWGARPADIGEAWRLLTAGVEVGDTRISANTVIELALVFAIGLVLVRWLQAILRRTVLPRTRMDAGARTAIVTGVGYAGVILAALAAVSAAGLNLSSLTVVAGALSIGIGFGLQAIVSNFVSGIILLVERPIKEGDWIEVSGISGYVRKISVRATRIETFDRHDVIVPNADLVSGTVRNMTLSAKTGRLTIPFDVAYGADVARAREIGAEVARAHRQVLPYPPPTVHFNAMGESALKLELFCYLRDVNDYLTVRTDLNAALYERLRGAGLDIPFPQQVTTIANLDALVDALRDREAGGPERRRAGG